MEVRCVKACAVWTRVRPGKRRCGREDAEGGLNDSPMSLRIPPCPHRPPCPGCPRYGEPGAAPGPLSALAKLAAKVGISPPRVQTGAAQGFRHRARLAVRGRTNSPKLGIFQAGTHRIVDIPNCGIHHPLINRVARALKQVIRRSGVRPYAERPHSGDLRYLQVAVERSSQRAQVVLVGNGTTPNALAKTCEGLAEELGESLHSLWWNGQPDRSNAILGPHWQRVVGPETISERIGGAEVHFTPGAFGQSHLDLFEDIAQRVSEWVPDGSRLAEFYGGSGSLSLGMASRCASLQINEQNPHCLRGLEIGIQALPDLVQQRVQTAPGRAGERLDLLDGADVVLLDPPRRGLDVELLDALCRHPLDAPRRILYASCGIDSFLSDSKQLLEADRMRLVALEAYALFPYSEHLETLALFQNDEAASPTHPNRHRFRRMSDPTA